MASPLITFGKPQRPRNATAVAARKVTRWVQEDGGALPQPASPAAPAASGASGGAGASAATAATATARTSATATGSDNGGGGGGGSSSSSGTVEPILPGGGVISATEVECNIPGCAPLEVVVAFYSAEEGAPNFAAKVSKQTSSKHKERSRCTLLLLRQSIQTRRL